MAVGALMFLAVPALLIIAGACILVQAALGLRRGSSGRLAGILGIIAGAGVLLCGPLSVLGLMLEIPYGVVILPMLAAIAAAAWALTFLVAAALAQWLSRE